MKCNRCDKTIDTGCQYEVEVHHVFVCHLEKKLEAVTAERDAIKKQYDNVNLFGLSQYKALQIAREALGTKARFGNTVSAKALAEIDKLTE